MAVEWDAVEWDDLMMLLSNVEVITKLQLKGLQRSGSHFELWLYTLINHWLIQHYSPSIF